MPRPAKPFVHQGYYCTDAGGSRRKLCPVEAGLAAAQTILAATTLPAALTLAGAYARFASHAETYYRLPSGKPSSEIEAFRRSFRELLELYGTCPAASLTREHLRTAREAMVKRGLSRRVINQRIGRVKRAMRWLAAEAGCVPDSVAAAFAILPNLQPHRSPAPETERILPIEAAIVRQTLNYLAEPWASLARLQWWTGLRPAEAAELQVAECVAIGSRLVLDFGSRHKMAYRGRPRRVECGPQAMLVLLPWLARAVRTGRAAVFVQASRRTRATVRRDSYDRAVRRAAIAAGVPPWHPNQLRHAFATRVRAAFGLEAAGAAIGHAKMSATEIYAERDAGLARRVAEVLG